MLLNFRPNSGSADLILNEYASPSSHCCPVLSLCLQTLIPIASSAGFPPSAYVIPSPVAFPGLQVNPGFTFSTGVSVPGPFLQQPVHTQAGTQVQAGKQSHIPYSQQRPSGPGPGQGPGSSGHGPSQAQQGQTQTPSQQALQQSVQLTMSQQQSPTKPVQQVGMGKSPPHHPGLQQVRSHDCHCLCFSDLIKHESSAERAINSAPKLIPV